MEKMDENKGNLLDVIMREILLDRIDSIFELNTKSETLPYQFDLEEKDMNKIILHI